MTRNSFSTLILMAGLHKWHSDGKSSSSEPQRFVYLAEMQGTSQIKLMVTMKLCSSIQLSQMTRRQSDNYLTILFVTIAHCYTKYKLKQQQYLILLDSRFGHKHQQHILTWTDN